ncbi:NnrS family protein [Albidovulum sediminis]|uniref:NnrS family protein n=1 Tax=Albidovulum sediminis TaxID=3066345 RepID=A0ABT2NNQ4_9RHOB|nr:NnrS family protein [Defluviimonas sediminis]MCT8330519.1 NnrS family protein [Defluviimonas sediminis]
MTRPRAALWRHPAGVFFTLAGIMAAALPWVWILPLDDPRLAHLRLGVFGFGGAAVVGYVLTAQRAWTGQDAPLGAPVLGLLAIAARIVSLVRPEAVGALVLLLFAIALAVLWPVVIARRWWRLPLASAPLALAVAEVAVIAGHLPASPLLLAMAALILAVGGRAVPAFLAAEQIEAAASPRFWPGLALILAGMALAGTAWGTTWGTAALALAAVWVLTRLRGASRAGAANRMLAMAYAGLCPALVVQAAAGAGAIPALAAEHLLAMGVMGPMVLAFAARATMLRPPGSGLVPRRHHWLAFALLLLAAAIRAGAEAAQAPAGWIVLSGLLWSGGWIAFLSAHLPALAHPAPFPVLSAARPAQTLS